MPLLIIHVLPEQITKQKEELECLKLKQLADEEKIVINQEMKQLADIKSELNL